MDHNAERPTTSSRRSRPLGPRLAERVAARFDRILERIRKAGGGSLLLIAGAGVAALVLAATLALPEAPFGLRTPSGGSRVEHPAVAVVTERSLPSRTTAGGESVLGIRVGSLGTSPVSPSDTGSDGFVAASGVTTLSGSTHVHLAELDTDGAAAGGAKPGDDDAPTPTSGKNDDSGENNGGDSGGPKGSAPGSSSGSSPGAGPEAPSGGSKTNDKAKASDDKKTSDNEPAKDDKKAKDQSSKQQDKQIKEEQKAIDKAAKEEAKAAEKQAKEEAKAAEKQAKEEAKAAEKQAKEDDKAAEEEAKAAEKQAKEDDKAAEKAAKEASKDKD